MIIRTAARCRYCKSKIAAGGQTAWRHGKILVLSRSGRLPARCIKTGNAADVWQHLHLRWTKHELAVFYLLGWLGVYLIGVRAEVDVPLSAAYAKRRKRNALISVGVSLIGAIFTFVALLADISSAISGWLKWPGYLMLFSGVISAVYWNRIVKPTKITDEFIWMKGVHPAVLDTLPVWDGIE